MSKKSIPFIIFAIAVLTLAYFGAPIVKDRYAGEKSASESTTKTPETTDDLNADEQVDETADQADNADENADSEDIVIEDSFLDILPSDCDNECKNFTDPEDLTYCKQVCGIATEDETTKKDSCEAIEDDLQRDYCFKNLAISKTDPKICDQIFDTNIKKTCVNRITEDIVDTQQSLEQ